MTHRDGIPRFSVTSAWRGDAGRREPRAPSTSIGPPESPDPRALGKPPFRSRGRHWNPDGPGRSAIAGSGPGPAPGAIGRPLLTRAVAYGMPVTRHGGLGPAVRRRLRKVAIGAAARSAVLRARIGPGPVKRLRCAIYTHKSSEEGLDQAVNSRDAHGVSFVSITQAFNTTTSMGRLTRNAPLGHDVEARKLVIDRAEAATVRKLFRFYLGHGTVRLVKEKSDGH